MSNITGYEVGTEKFWKRRLFLAKQNGTLHYSVFLAKQSLWDRLLEAHLEVIHQFIKPEDSVLDAGCGYGRMSVYFPNYVGVDFSPDFIAEAKSLFPEKQFSVEDLNKLPFKKNQFDWGLVISIKHMIIGNIGVKEWNKMQKEIKRVCKKVLILEYGELESEEDTKESQAKYEIL